MQYIVWTLLEIRALQSFVFYYDVIPYILQG